VTARAEPVPAGTSPVWWLPAPAKLNLSLAITGRRGDGYHLLETLFHALDLADDLWLARHRQPGVVLTVRAERPELQVPVGPDNLVVRALDGLAQAVGYRGGFRVHLHKRIPHGGGLGGGSSDAATALRLGAHSLGGACAGVPLRPLAARLGADVAFFLRGGSQWGRGIGDELTPAEVPRRHFVLVAPPFGCPTVAVYKMYAALWNAHGTGGSVRGSAVPPNGDTFERMQFPNALLTAAEQVRPELAALRQRLGRLGLGEVAMTGSGSTLFLAFPTAEAANAAHGRLAASEAAAGCTLYLTASAAPSLPKPRLVGWPAEAHA
jgi:4-diphosphocytidyl-2-C-methyl-D-erythritol kinase